VDECKPLVGGSDAAFDIAATTSSVVADGAIAGRAFQGLGLRVQG
jgi:hypothetical protein